MGVSHLQYADDTLILIEPSDEGIANLKLLLLCFGNMSGLKINFNKNEVLVTGVAAPEQRRIASMLNCRLGQFPMKYLGLLVSNKPLRVSLGFPPSKVGHRVD
jgi:mannosylglycoprotein endo-beta-mannosidase